MFGECVAAFNQEARTSGITERGMGTTCLRPTKSMQGRHEVINLHIGQVISRSRIAPDDEGSKRQHVADGQKLKDAICEICKQT